MKNKDLILVLIVFLFISSCDSIDGDTLIFSEENLIPREIITYSDHSIVFRLIRRLNDTCNIPTLSYRILYPNGTHNLITVYDHQIPPFNFCIDDDPNKLNLFPEKVPGKIIFDQVDFIVTIPNYVFVLYNRITEENGIVKFGMLIDWSGKIIR